MTENGRTETSTLDLIGIGCGPANLALGAAIADASRQDPSADLNSLFFDLRPKPAWHPGMMLEDAQLQLNVLKDLATPRDPTSHFSFLNYLHNKERLTEYLNLREFYPTRIEYNDYIRWVAEQLGDRLRFSAKIVGVEPIVREGRVSEVEVIGQDVATGEEIRRRGRSLVVASGPRPKFPPGISLVPGGRAIHTSEFLPRIHDEYPDATRPWRFGVVGGGQSAGEIFYYLMNHFPKADVTSVVRRFGFKPVDDSDFTNEVFFPEQVDRIYELPEEKRRLILEDTSSVNYAVVDLPLIQSIYKKLYREKVQGRNRARVRSYLELESLEERESTVVAHFRDRLTDEPAVQEFDALIMCTGYVYDRDHPLLEDCNSWFLREDSGRLRVTRNYRIETQDAFEVPIFLQGSSEETHGPSEPVLTLVATRAEEIRKSLTRAFARTVGAST